MAQVTFYLQSLVSGRSCQKDQLILKQEVEFAPALGKTTKTVIYRSRAPG